MQAETPPFVFNPYAPEFEAEPATTYRYLQAHAPVYYWERGRVFLLSKYEDVLAAMKDPRFSRSARDGLHYQPLPASPEYEDHRQSTEHGLFMVTPADHLRLRRLINPSFSPKAVEWLRGKIVEVTRQALDELPDDEVVDLAPLANNIPMRVIGKLLAVPAEFEPGFLEFGRIRLQLISPIMPTEQRDALVRGLAPGYKEFHRLISERRQRPGEDLLSTLIHHEEEGVKLSEPELLGLVEALIVAGTDTTGHTLRFLLLDLMRNPEQLARVRADPSRARDAMEESLRFDKFNRFGVPIYALEDVTIRGVTIGKGQMVMPLTGAMGHDPEVFERAGQFDIDRPDLGEIRNFGAGPHACLGLHLARLEFEIILPMILERFAEMSLAGPPEYQPHAYFRVIGRLPIRVRRAAT
jgi:cytochrome P450